MYYWLYFIKNDNTNLYKIGITKNVTKRLSQIKIADSQNLLKLEFLVLEDSKSEILFLEKKLHNIFKLYNIKFLNYREWFELPYNFEVYLSNIKYYKNKILFEDINNHLVCYNFTESKLTFCYNYKNLNELTLKISENNCNNFILKEIDNNLINKLTKKAITYRFNL